MYGLIPALLGKRNLIEHGLQIKAGAADQNRHLAARLYLFDGLLCELLEAHCVKILLRLQNIDQMMRHALHLRRRDFCGSDVHVPIHLHGVGGDNFSVERFCECQREHGFAGRRGPRERYQRLFFTQCA